MKIFIIIGGLFKVESMIEIFTTTSIFPSNRKVARYLNVRYFFGSRPLMFLCTVTCVATIKKFISRICILNVARFQNIASTAVEQRFKRMKHKHCEKLCVITCAFARTVGGFSGSQSHRIRLNCCRTTSK